MEKLHVSYCVHKNLNTQTKNLKLKGVPGTFRPPEYRRWIPYPILAQNGFDSPPGNPNRGLRGRHRPLPGADIWAEKQSIMITIAMTSMCVCVCFEFWLILLAKMAFLG